MGEHFFMTRDTKKIRIICGAKQFSIIYYITVWGIGKLAPLLSERSGRGGSSPLPNGANTKGGGVVGGVHLVG